MAILIPSSYKFWGKCLIGFGIILVIGVGVIAVVNDPVSPELQVRKMIWNFLHAPFIAGLLLLVLAREKNEDERSINIRKEVMTRVLLWASLLILLHICIIKPFFWWFYRDLSKSLFDSGPSLTMFILLFVHLNLKEARYKDLTELNEEPTEGNADKK